MVCTDAPFLVAIGEPVTPSDHREDAMVSAETTDSDFLELNRNWMKAVFPHLVNGGLLGPLSIGAACRLATLPQQPLFKKRVAAHVNSISLGKRGRHRTNLWTCTAALVGPDVPDR